MRFVRVWAVAAVGLVMAALGPAPIAMAGVSRDAGYREIGHPASFHLPYTDPGQAGLLTLCNQANQPITHGSITAKPFVWRAVGSVPAPSHYRVKGATASLFAYQPRPYTPAEAWSGLPMAAASVYSNPAHPMIQSTPIDEPLDWFTKFFPPVWEHLIELRLYLGGPNRPTDTLGFAAADLQISGNTWTMVEGGHASCTSGTAVSREVIIGLPGASGSPKPATPATPASSATGGAAAARTASPAPTSAGSSSAGPAAGSAAAGSAAGKYSSSGNSGALAAVAGVGALVVALLATGGLWWRRRRRAAL